VKERHEGVRPDEQVERSGFPTQHWNSEVCGWNDTTLTYLADVNGDSRAAP